MVAGVPVAILWSGRCLEGRDYILRIMKQNDGPFLCEENETYLFNLFSSPPQGFCYNWMQFPTGYNLILYYDLYMVGHMIIPLGAKYTLPRRPLLVLKESLEHRIYS